MTSRTLVLGQYGLVLGLLAVGSLLEKFAGGTFSIMLYMFGPLLFGASALVVLGWGLWRPHWKKVGTALLALAAGMAIDAAAPSFRRWGDHLFFETRKARLEEFTRELLEYGRIWAMSDGQRHFKELNGELVAYTATQVDTARREPTTRPILAVESVLARDSIDRRVYESFRARLQELKLIEIQVQPEYAAYLYDGILDNLQGYLFVRPGHRPPRLGSELFLGELVALSPRGDGWYWFATR